MKSRIKSSIILVTTVLTLMVILLIYIFKSEVNFKVSNEYIENLTTIPTTSEVEVIIETTEKATSDPLVDYELNYIPDWASIELDNQDSIPKATIIFDKKALGDDFGDKWGLLCLNQVIEEEKRKENPWADFINEITFSKNVSLSNEVELAIDVTATAYRSSEDTRAYGYVMRYLFIKENDNWRLVEREG